VTAFADLLRVDQERRIARPCPKSAVPTRLEEHEDKRLDEKKAWASCCRKVDTRDGVLCRCCGRKTVKTLELQVDRAEHAHIIRRSREKTLKYDSRNVFKVCHACHEKFDHHEIEIIGKAADMFALSGRKFLNADKPLHFGSVKP
jgi:hypothetical protein